jgi:hypothetical protein
VSNSHVLHTDDGAAFELQFEGSAEVERGPLGRFIDLAEQIKAEGGVVPARIQQALDLEAEPITGDQP